MTTYLTRTDEARNMARFYTMHVQATLFGEWSLVREWGRIGRAGQVRATPYPSPAEAEAAGWVLSRREVDDAGLSRAHPGVDAAGFLQRLAGAGLLAQAAS